MRALAARTELASQSGRGFLKMNSTHLPAGELLRPRGELRTIEKLERENGERRMERLREIEGDEISRFPMRPTGQQQQRVREKRESQNGTYVVCATKKENGRGRAEILR